MKNNKYFWVYLTIGILVLGGIAAYLFLGKTKTVTFTQDNLTYEITKNKITKNAVVKISYPITDDVESADFMGKKITMVPFAVNFTCAASNAAFFDIDSFDNIVASFNEGDTVSKPITQNEGFLEKLEKYEIKEFSIDFFDSEDKGKIAKCSSKEKGNENIKFEVYRDYSGVPSLFGVKIGVFGK